MILSRSEHKLSRKEMDRNALKVMYRLHNHGYKAYLVGGGVRDILLSRKPKDFDIATDARPSQVKKLFNNCRIIGRRFRLAHILFSGGQVIEVSTFRRKSEWDPSNCEAVNSALRPENEYGTPEEDAHRRDLTINGLFYNIANYTIIDYVGGLEDLQNGIVRVIGDAAERLTEDPVRMIRVIRHAARTGFTIEDSALNFIRENNHLINQCSSSRVREEFMRELRGGFAVESFKLQSELGMLEPLFPEYQELLNQDPEKTFLGRLLLNLRGADKIIQSGKTITDPELMAVFLSPLVRQLGAMDTDEKGRAGVSKINREVRDVLKPILRRFGFSKGNSELISQMIFAQYMLNRAIETKKLPKGLFNKAYFAPGLRLFQVEATGRGQTTPQMFIDAARQRNVDMLTAPGKSGRRRRKRSNKPYHKQGPSKPKPEQ